MCVFLQMTSRILSAQPSAITYLRLKLLTNARHQRPTPNFDKRCMWQHRIFLRDCRLVFLFPCLSISLSLPFMRESLPYCCPGDRWLTYSERQDTCYLGFCPAGLAILLACRGPALCTHAHCWKGQQVSTENAGPRDGSIWPQAARGQAAVVDNLLHSLTRCLGASICVTMDPMEENDVASLLCDAFVSSLKVKVKNWFVPSEFHTGYIIGYTRTKLLHTKHSRFAPRHKTRRYLPHPPSLARIHTINLYMYHTLH